MDDKIRIASAKYGNIGNKIKNSGTSSSPPRKNERPVSAIYKKVYYNKSPTPHIDLNKFKKFNVNVNVNLNENNSNISENLPLISGNIYGSNNITHTPKTNYSQISSPPKGDKSSIINNTSLPNKVKMANKMQGSNINANAMNIENGNLLDENMKMRTAINKFKSEVTLLRNAVMKTENELKQKEKMIEELLNIEKSVSSNQNLYNFPSNNSNVNSNINNQVSSDKNKSKEFTMITNLKKQCQELHTILKTKEDEIKSLKKLATLTKINEMSIENMTLNQELDRIKLLYENSQKEVINEKNSKEIDKLQVSNSKEIQKLQESNSKQLNLINSLQDRNKLLLNESNQKHQKITKLKEKIQELEKLKTKNSKEPQNIEDNINQLIEEKNLKLQKKKGKSKLLKQEIQLKTNEINILKNQLEKVPQTSANENLQEEYERKIRMRKEKSKVLKSNIKEKSEEIEKLLSKINEISNDKTNSINEDDHLKLRGELLYKLNKKKAKSLKLKKLLEEKEEDLQKTRNLLNNLNQNDNDPNTSKSPEKLMKFLQARVEELSKEVVYYKELSDKREVLLNDLQSANLRSNNTDVSLLESSTMLINDLRAKIKKLKEELKEKDLEILKSKLENRSIRGSINEEDEHQMTEDHFNEMTYILIKNFEAHQITVKSFQNKVFNNLREPSQLIEELAEKIMQIIINTNISNKKELLLYLKYIALHHGKNIETLRVHLCSLFDSITYYSNKEQCEMYNHLIKTNLTRFGGLLKTEMKKKDPNNSGYITFSSLRQILEHLKIEIDLNLIEYFIYLMKNFHDPESHFRDLKYNSILKLVVEELEMPFAEIRRGSNLLASSQVLILDNEYNSRAENILSKIAEILFTQRTTTKKAFTPTLTIEDGEKNRYTAMYMKLFLKTLRNEMSLTIDRTDSLCLFNKLKNDNNVYNLKVVDIDKLIIEMSKFGIYENEDENISGKNLEMNMMDKNDSLNVVEFASDNNSENIYSIQKNIEKCEINLAYEIKIYMRSHNTNFEKLIFLVHPHMIINSNDERLIKLEIFLKYLVDNNIIFSSTMDRKTLDDIVDVSGFIKINVLKRAVSEVLIDKEEEFKRYSKVLIDGVFNNSIALLENNFAELMIEKHEQEMVQKNAARNMTNEFIFEALSKYKETVAAKKLNEEIFG